MPARMWRHGINSFLELLRYGRPTSLEHMATLISLVYSMMAFLHETVSDCRLLYDGRSPVSVQKPTELRLEQGVVVMKSPQIEYLFPTGWSFRRLLWTDELYTDDSFQSDTLDHEERRFDHPFFLERIHGGLSWYGSCAAHPRSPGSCLVPFDDLQNKGHSDGQTVPRHHLSPSHLISVVPRKLLGLVILTAVAIPVVSAELPGADVVTMAWAFGIMANVPSVYVLANPPVPSGVNNGAEEVFWKIARGW